MDRWIVFAEVKKSNVILALAALFRNGVPPLAKVDASLTVTVLIPLVVTYVPTTPPLPSWGQFHEIQMLPSPHISMGSISPIMTELDLMCLPDGLHGQATKWSTSKGRKLQAFTEQPIQLKAFPGA